MYQIREIKYMLFHDLKPEKLVENINEFINTEEDHCLRHPFYIKSYWSPENRMFMADLLYELLPTGEHGYLTDLQKGLEDNGKAREEDDSS
jgi:hypothetical protein